MGGGPSVDNTECLRGGLQLLRQLFLGQRTGLPEGGAAEKLVQRVGVRANLPHGESGRQLGKEGLQGRLGGGAQDRCDAIILHQLTNGGDAGVKVADREGLRLVEDDNTVGDVVQLAAAGGKVTVERFKKLHCGGDDDRRIPVFSG